MFKPQPKFLPMHARDKRQHRPRPRFRPLATPPASLRRAIGTTSGQMIAGLALGQAGVVVYDWLTSGPGPFVVFGL